MKTSVRAAALLIGAMALSALGTVSASAESIKITILGAGDVYKFEGGGAPRGGFARMNAVARAERAANPNTLYVFDGDLISPSLLSGLDKGSNTIQLTNIVPFDMAVPGNHEFDFGPDVFLERIKESKYPWHAINITGPGGAPIEGLGGVVTKTYGTDLKVALIPVAIDSTPETADAGDWEFQPTVATALEAARQAAADGADLVIGVVQASRSQDEELLASHLFDVIVSGDDHDFRLIYDGVTVLNETSTEANYLTAIDLAVEVTPAEGDNRRTVSWSPSFRFIDTANVEPDPETQALVEELAAKLSAELDVALGTTASPLDSRRNIVRTQESAVGNLIADAIRGANGADVAITNGGGIRGDKEYPAGATLTRRDILTELPFGNVTVVTELSGQAILEALENGVSQIEDGAGRFPQVSGMVVEIDPSQPAGSRVVSVTVGGAPLDPAKTYTVATNDYMLGGGDGYTALGKGKVLINASAGNLMATDVMNYVQAAGAVDAKLEGRIVIKQ